MHTILELLYYPLLHPDFVHLQLLPIFVVLTGMNNYGYILRVNGKRKDTKHYEMESHAHSKSPWWQMIIFAYRTDFCQTKEEANFAWFCYSKTYDKEIRLIYIIIIHYIITKIRMAVIVENRLLTFCFSTKKWHWIVKKLHCLNSKVCNKKMIDYYSQLHEKTIDVCFVWSNSLFM